MGREVSRKPSRSRRRRFFTDGLIAFLVAVTVAAALVLGTLYPASFWLEHGTHEAHDAGHRKK